MLAPIGSLQSITPEGGLAVAKAAEQFGTVNFVSSVTQPSLEEIAAASGNPKIFQLYVQGDLKWVENLLARAKQAGYSALCLTVDTAHYGHRERQMMDRWLPPSRRGVGYEYRAGLTWELMDAINEMAGLPFILKGIATAEAGPGHEQVPRGTSTFPNTADAILTTAGQIDMLRNRRRCGGKAEILIAAVRAWQRRAQGHRPWRTRRGHRQTARLGTRCRRSGRLGAGARNTQKRDRHHHGTARHHAARSTHRRLRGQSSAVSSGP